MRHVVTLLALIGVVIVLFAAAVLSTRTGPVLADAPPDAVHPALPPGPLQPEDVAEVRFAMALRGYRMSEVDAVLQRLAADLRARDERIAVLEQAQTGSGAPPAEAVAPLTSASPERASPEASPP